MSGCIPRHGVLWALSVWEMYEKDIGFKENNNKITTELFIYIFPKQKVFLLVQGHSFFIK